MTFLMGVPEVGKNENATKHYIQNCIQKYIDTKIDSTHTELFVNNSKVNVEFTVSKKSLPDHLLHDIASKYYVIEEKYRDIDRDYCFITRDELLRKLKEYCFVLEIK